MSMDNSMIAHEWAHGRDKKYARSNVFAESGTIYSYGRHFPMARFYSVTGGGRVVLFTSHGYSVSTARHLNYVRGAVRGNKVFTVDKVCSSGGGDLDNRGHKENHRKLLDEVGNLVAKSKGPRLRQSTRDSLLSEARATLQAANEYRAAFKLGGKDVVSVELASEKVEAAARRAEVAARKAEAARVAARMGDYEKWKRGEYDGVFSGLPVAFRRRRRGVGNDVGRLIETSLGAAFPAADAVAAWPRIKAVRAVLPANSLECPFVPNSENEADGVLTIGGFRVSRIDASGIRVGCHDVSWEAAESLAKLLGVK